ncbi:MAG: RNA polymerase sigma factor [Polyangiaceae bacterium]
MLTEVPVSDLSLRSSAFGMRLASIESRLQPRIGESAGDARLRELMAAYFDFVWRSLRRLGLSAADADDGTQEVFVVASRKLGVIVPESEKRFLFATALRVASTRRRGLKRRREDPHSWLGDEEQEPECERSEPGPERLVELARARRELAQILAGMKLEQRAVFILYELEELSVPEIAQLTDVPVGTVSSRLRCAREEFDSSLRRLRVREQFQGVKA